MLSAGHELGSEFKSSHEKIATLLPSPSPRFLLPDCTGHSLLRASLRDGVCRGGARRRAAGGGERRGRLWPIEGVCPGISQRAGGEPGAEERPGNQIGRAHV